MSVRSALSPLLTVLVAALLVVTVANVAIGGPGRSDDHRDHRDHRDEFEARLRGGNEVPSVDSEARGKAEFEVHRRRTTTTLDYEISWRRGTDMLAAAGSHLHCGPAGENGPVVAFLAGVVVGGLDGDVEFAATLSDDNIVNPACGATIAELVESMAAGEVYVNVHSAANPGGEIRGQVSTERHGRG